MNTLLLIAVLSAPFVALGALIWWLVVTIGAESSQRK
jgi:hypothetical protein